MITITKTKMEFEVFGLSEVLEMIQCEDVDEAQSCIYNYYLNESLPLIYFRHVSQFLTEIGLDYQVDDSMDDDYDLWSTPINILD